MSEVGSGYASSRAWVHAGETKRTTYESPYYRPAMLEILQMTFNPLASPSYRSTLTIVPR